MSNILRNQGGDTNMYTHSFHEGEDPWGPLNIILKQEAIIQREETRVCMRAVLVFNSYPKTLYPPLI